MGEGANLRRSSAGGRGSEGGGGSRGNSSGGGAAPPQKKSINPFVNFNMGLGTSSKASRAEPMPPTAGRGGGRGRRADPSRFLDDANEVVAPPKGLGDLYDEHISDEGVEEVPRAPGVMRLTPQPPSSSSDHPALVDEDRTSAGMNAPRRLMPTPGKRNQILPMIA